MIIRHEQMEIFGDYMRSQFENRTAVHLRQSFPDRTAAMTEPELLARIRRGIQQAETYEIRLEGDVRIFLEAVIYYGEDFDVAPETPWCRKILSDKSRNPSEKMYQLDAIRRGKVTA